ncbi:alpha-ribazole phosphatase [Flavitalea flava]
MTKEIFLIRHTTPAVAKGICYGQTDLEVTGSFLQEAAIIREYMPQNMGAVHSSPLQRCAGLAGHLFPEHSIQLHKELMEIHCGQWEMKSWDELPKDQIDPWMKDFVQVRIPDGESYLDLHQRVTGCFDSIRKAAEMPVAIVAHGGVIRSILSYITDTPLIDSFKVFSLNYGCVIRLFEKEGNPGPLQYEILSNKEPEEKERHKPTGFEKR